MAKLNTLNPESLIYENGLLNLTVLGGIKLEGLDRMRVLPQFKFKPTGATVKIFAKIVIFGKQKLKKSSYGLYNIAIPANRLFRANN